MSIKKFIKKLFKDDNAGSLVEYGLIIGFSILSFIIIVGIINSILDWSTTALSDFLNSFKI